MGQLDAIVHLVLYACFAVYVLMGLILLVMGVVYMGDAGAVRPILHAWFSWMEF
jgi:hypothetical protein